MPAHHPGWLTITRSIRFIPPRPASFTPHRSKTREVTTMCRLHAWNVLLSKQTAVIVVKHGFPGWNWAAGKLLLSPVSLSALWHFVSVLIYRPAMSVTIFSSPALDSIYCASLTLSVDDDIVAANNVSKVPSNSNPFCWKFISDSILFRSLVNSWSTFSDWPNTGP